MIKQLGISLLSRFGYVVKRRRSGIQRRGDTRAEAINSADLMLLLHGKNIYEGYDFKEIPPDTQGWGSDSKAFGKLIEEIRPRLIIEVGTWKGGSAITMANALRESGGGIVLCVDTWLGAVEMWNDKSDPERFLSLRCKQGFPQVYFTFLANVCHAGLQDFIVPFPLHSSSAALWLMMHGVLADMIYVDDASHEEEDVYQDLLDYYELVRPKGVLFGDDWSWTGVRSAVTRFAAERKVQINHLDDKWVIRKNG